jgi:uncharacterized protein
MMLPLELDLTKIERLSIKRENENYSFRAFLKGKDIEKVDKIVHRLHKEITSLIDCQKCGNCCISLVPRVKENEIVYLAGLDKVSVEEFIRENLEPDNYDNSLFLKHTPCRYLSGTRCSIYENRPLECKAYPYTHRPGFSTRTLNMISNYGICPIVFNIMENLKMEMGYKHYRR